MIPARRSLVVGLVATLLALGACSSDAPEKPAEDPSSPAASESSAAPVVDLPEATVIEDIPGAQSIDARPSPDWVLVAAGKAWIANVDKGVAMYDSRTGRTLGSVDTGTEICTGMASGFGSLWAVDCAQGFLFRIDLRTGKRLAKIELPFGVQSEGSIAAGGGGVYVVKSDGSEVARVDAATNKVTDQFPAPSETAGLRYGFASLWSTNPRSETVSRLDPLDGTVEETVSVGTGAYFQDVGFGAVWVLNNSTGVVSRIDPETMSATAIPVSAEPIDGGDLAVGGDSVWARVSEVLVARIDPATNQVVERIGASAGSGSADADRQSVWISAHDKFVVYRVPIN